MMNKYPIGATWEASNEKGRICIWLDSRSEFMEVWRWSFEYSDGSRGAGWDFGDWSTSYRGCLKQCSFKLVQKDGKVPRMKRIK